MFRYDDGREFIVVMNIVSGVCKYDPLIALAGIRQLDLLCQLYSKIAIQRAVYSEIISEPTWSLVTSA